jgi:ribosomal protein L11 methyltransferase
MANWLEVSLIVDGELTEAVAEVLARFAPDGVVMENGVRFQDADDPGVPDRSVTVRAYLPMDENLAEARQKLEESLWYLGRIQPLPEPTFTPIADQNWMEAWKQHYRPIPVGERLMIVPAWLEPPDSGRIPIRIDPGMAFGTGTHPSTQLCLGLMEKYMETCHAARGGWSPINEDILHPLGAQNDTSTRVIDIGCGSGILSIAALKLGAVQALGMDVDKQALDSARRNALVNGIGEELLLGLGSVAEIKSGVFPFQQAPLVVANILASVLTHLFKTGLAELLTPNGVLILSGILQEQAETVLEVAQTHSLRLGEQRRIGDWVAQVYVR